MCVSQRACLQNHPRWCSIDWRGSARVSTAFPLPASQLLSTAVFAALTPPSSRNHLSTPPPCTSPLRRSQHTHTHTQHFTPPPPRRHRRCPRRIRVCGSGLDSASQKRLPDPPLPNPPLLKWKSVPVDGVCVVGRLTHFTSQRLYRTSGFAKTGKC